MEAMAFYVYVLRCSDTTYYTGVTTDVVRRVRQHNGELVGGAKYTHTRRPVRLVYQEEHGSRSAAQKREYELKKLSHTEKRQLANMT